MKYSELEPRILMILDKTPHLVLATANKSGVVSAVQMSFVHDGLTVFMQTDANFEKVKNIEENPHVALNLGSFYFKGTARILGKPTSNKEFIEKIKRKDPGTYAHYTNLPNEVLIEVRLTECKIFGIDSSTGEETIQVVNLKSKTVETIVCDKM